MNVTSVKPDDLLMKAGECFMFLLWSETAMCDLVVLKEGGNEMRKRYSEAFGKEPHPRDFSRRRLELGSMGFNKIKTRFLDHWPQWKDIRDVRDAIERIVIWRNGLGHANVQPFRGYLLYTPTETSLKQVRKYTKCHKCLRYHNDCVCLHHDLGDPLSLIVKHETLRTIYEDIRTVDIECYYRTAISLGVEYQGVAWPKGDGTYVFKENHSVRD